MKPIANKSKKMNWIASIFRMANKDWTSRLFTLVLIGLLTYSASTIFKAKKEDCKPYKEIANDLMEALKKSPTVFEPVQSSYQFASYADTTKPMTAREWSRYRDSVIRVTQKKLDSLKQKK